MAVYMLFPKGQQGDLCPIPGTLPGMLPGMLAGDDPGALAGFASGMLPNCTKAAQPLEKQLSLFMRRLRTSEPSASEVSFFFDQM